MAEGDLSLVYMTAGSMEEARRIGKALVEGNLAACVNLLPGMHSIYNWQEELQEDEEVVLIAKTQSALVPRLTAEVKNLHTYDCPCVVSLPISGGNVDFLEWIQGRTR